MVQGPRYLPFHILSLQVDALVAAVAQLQANVREIQRTTVTASTAANEFDAVTISYVADTYHNAIFKLPFLGRYLTRCWCGAPSAALSTSRDGPSRLQLFRKQFTATANCFRTV